MSNITQALIADDHSLYRDGLALLLKDQLGFDTVLEATSLENAIAMMDGNPNMELALFDLAMPGMRGPGTLAQLRLRHPDIKITVVSASESRSDVLAAIAAGLSGFLPKTLPCSEFITALELVRSGRIYVPGLMKLPGTDEAETRLGSSSNHSGADGDHAATSRVPTRRQRDVLECVRRGMTNRQIAEKLQISVATVKAHIAALLTITHAKNRVRLMQLTGSLDEGREPRLGSPLAADEASVAGH